MLARRMLLFVVMLLAVTTLAAGLAPPPPRTLDRSPSPTAPSSVGRTAIVERRLDASRQRPATIVVEEGDILNLTVSADETDAVELQGLGAVRAVAPETPVIFDVLTDTPGEYPVVLLDAGRTVGTVRVVTQRE